MNFIPYGKQTISQDDISAISEAMKSDFLTTGSKVTEFEKAICDYTGSKNCVTVTSATAGLHLASLVLLKKGDKVLTTPNTFLATSNSILYAGAKPVFVDIAEDGNIDLDLVIRELENGNGDALYGVHFSGNSLNQDKLKYIREKFGIPILEDTAHSLGGSFGDIKNCSCENSDISILSFHPVKNMTTGEGGAITTNSKEIYEKLVTLRNHGMVKTSEMKPWEYEMRELGFNYRLTDFQCALGISQLKRLNSFLERRREIAKKYDYVFEKTNILPLYKYNPESAYHLYVVQVDFSKLLISKEDFFIEMRNRKIGLQLHYIPINKQPYYRDLDYGDEVTPKMDRYYETSFSIPIFPLLKDSEQNYIIENMLDLLK